MQAMWKCGAEEQLAMCMLLNPGELASVDRMALRYPETPVVIDHLARIGVDGRIGIAKFVCCAVWRNIGRCP